MNFRVELNTYRGPLDLLLYLVRKHEIDVTDIPIALVADQFLAHLAVLEQLDVDAVGDFLEMASTLIEIKSRMVLPRGGEEVDELDDPRDELVERLLEYKKYKDAASMLEERSRQWQQHHARLTNDLPPRRVDLSEQPIREAELWDLVSAFGRIMRENVAVQPANIVYDETPIHIYMERLHGRLRRQGRVALSEAIEPGMHKSALIGLFLAVLELVRHHDVWTEQDALHGEIFILPGSTFHEKGDFATADDYAHGDGSPEPEPPAEQGQPAAPAARKPDRHG